VSELWENYPLQSLVIKVGSGSTPKGGSEAYKAVGTPLIRSMNVVFFGFKRAGLAYIDANQAAQLDNATVNAGDVLLNITGASIGRVTLAPDEFEGARVNQHVCIIRPNEALDARFLNAYLSSPALQSQIWNDNFGVTRQALTKQQILDFEVPVPPKAEQTRIANQLETLLARVQACNDRFDAIPALLKRFRQAVLDAAVSGALTYSWRVECDAADWSATTVSSICQQRRVITYGVVKLGDEVPNGTPCLRTSNVRWLRFELDGMKRIAPSLSAEYSRTILRGGEVLVNVRGTLGGVAVAGNEMMGWNISREVAVLPVDQRVVNPHFAAYWVASNASQKWLAGMEKGIAYVGINIEDLRNLPIRLPSLPEQAEIVRRVEGMFALADQIETRSTAARAQAQRLNPLVLAKAFRGELVPQDSNDEPASALLARIASSNIAVVEKNKRKVPVARKERAQAAINL
jgi:type I restriction enzyme S subunit